MEVKTTYFEKPGGEHTEETLHIARKRAEELGIKTVLVASTTGFSAVKAIEILQGLRVIAVTHITGYAKPDTQEFTEENRRIFQSKGGIVLTATHALGGVSRALLNRFNTVAVGDIISNTLRLFGQGVKVGCEMAIMAADAGLVRTDEDVIAVGGTARGADTAIVVRPVNTERFFDLKIREILCKPRL